MVYPGFTHTRSILLKQSVLEISLLFPQCLFNFLEYSRNVIEPKMFVCNKSALYHSDARLIAADFERHPLDIVMRFPWLS